VASPRTAWIRARLRPPRRLRIRRSGALLIAGTLALGLATLNTGNNLLYLLLGGLLGAIVLSGWLSERAIRSISVSRIPPRVARAGTPVRFAYLVRNRARWLSSFSLRVREAGQAAAAFVAIAPARGAAETAVDLMFARRGVHELNEVRLSTTYPFGFFEKERDLALPATIVVWPRTDRPVRHPRTGSSSGVGAASAGNPAPAAERGQFRSLRPYRPGDDVRDVHWRTSARLSVPVVREFERDRWRAHWIVLDTRGAPDAAAEAAIETAAALAAAAIRRGEAVGLAAGASRVEPAGGERQLEAVLDALARVDFGAGRTTNLPAPIGECVLVTARTADRDGYADVFSTADVIE
jgi:uncharacterized protein (DUF58 family)